jgi:hypothetical protein
MTRMRWCFEGAEGFAAGLALGKAAGEVGAGGWVNAGLGDGDDVQSGRRSAVR